jgi:hypothetical protein
VKQEQAPAAVDPGVAVEDWALAGDASWHGRVLTLTPDLPGRTGGALSTRATLPRTGWRVELDVRVGAYPDGIAIVWVDQDRVDLSDWLRGPGGYLGLRNDEFQGVPGWAVELDLYANSPDEALGDPDGPHVALVEDGQQQVPVAVAPLVALEADTWTRVSIRCPDVGLDVAVGGITVLRVEDWLSRGENGFLALTAATGQFSTTHEARSVQLWGGDFEISGSDSGGHP